LLLCPCCLPLLPHPCFVLDVGECGRFAFAVDHFDWGGEYYKRRGRMMPENGRDLAQTLEALVAAWPTHVHVITLVGHSMGGQIAARLAAGGESFVAALDVLDGAALGARDAGVLDKTTHAEWQDALRAAARRLEAAWLALETAVAEERRRWAVETDAIERWRPSLWPVIVVWTPLASALIWLGLVVGGYLVTYLRRPVTAAEPAPDAEHACSAL